MAQIQMPFGAPIGVGSPGFSSPYRIVANSSWSQQSPGQATRRVPSPTFSAVTASSMSPTHRSAQPGTSGPASYCGFWAQPISNASASSRLSPTSSSPRKAGQHGQVIVRHGTAPLSAQGPQVALASERQWRPAQPGVTTSQTNLPALKPESLATEGVREQAEQCEKDRVIHIGDRAFRCLDVLGRGSYSVVWRAQALPGPTSPAVGELPKVAVKEVECTSQAALLQAVFEVQVLLALDSDATDGRGLRVPRCISYKVEQIQNGAGGDSPSWTVHTAMTVVPGESLDVFYRRPIPPAVGPLTAASVSVAASSARKRACLLAERLLCDVSPSLRRLETIAWHRDVNSHNILVDTSVEATDLELAAEEATFWLIDFGLAVDSQSWTHPNGSWRTAHIGGDSRYWPASSWIMHLYGPEGLDSHDSLREQYQRRLDIHGLGITALELLCTVSISYEGAEEFFDPQTNWSSLCLAWQEYWRNAWRWWSLVYSVFLEGGDIAPVQAQLLEEGIIEHLTSLLEDLRINCRRCAMEAEEVGEIRTASVLAIVADLIDEGAAFDWDMMDSALAANAKDPKASSLTTTALVSLSKPPGGMCNEVPVLNRMDTFETLAPGTTPVTPVASAHQPLSFAPLDSPAARRAAHQTTIAQTVAEKPQPRPMASDSIPNSYGGYAIPSIAAAIPPIGPKKLELDIVAMKALVDRISNIEFMVEDPEVGSRLADRMRQLEISLLEVNRRSVERAKVGLERLTRRYIPKLMELTSR